jgi:hypothetical protein
MTKTVAISFRPTPWSVQTRPLLIQPGMTPADVLTALGFDSGRCDLYCARSRRRCDPDLDLFPDVEDAECLWAWPRWE